MLLPTIFGFLTFPATIVADSASCYGSDVVSTPSTDHRNVPWGSPTVHFSSLNGTLTTCCDSLDEIRTALDDIDDKLLDLLNSRYVYLPMISMSTLVKITKEGLDNNGLCLSTYTLTLTLFVSPEPRTSGRQLGSSPRELL